MNAGSVEGGERPWGVELSAGFLRDQVLTAYATIEKTYRTILENRDPVIIESKFRSRGTRNILSGARRRR